jgi:hypothetical protein
MNQGEAPEPVLNVGSGRSSAAFSRIIAAITWSSSTLLPSLIVPFSRTDHTMSAVVQQGCPAGANAAIEALPALTAAVRLTAKSSSVGCDARGQERFLATGPRPQYR